ncbi:MAG: hypothetical protein IPJ20_08720 [Flammeovirgaceae bacterium]|nr:hypothetical protein [Flammeovirgaceae bacterium]
MKASFLGLRTCIYKVTDLESATDWYTKAFETEPYFNESFYVGFNIAGYELGLIPDENPTQAKGDSVHTYWGVANVEKEYKRFISLGVYDFEEPHNVGWRTCGGSCKTDFKSLINPDPRNLSVSICAFLSLGRDYLRHDALEIKVVNQESKSILLLLKNLKTHSSSYSVRFPCKRKINISFPTGEVKTKHS